MPTKQAKIIINILDNIPCIKRKPRSIDDGASVVVQFCKHRELGFGVVFYMANDALITDSAYGPLVYHRYTNPNFMIKLNKTMLDMIETHKIFCNVCG